MELLWIILVTALAVTAAYFAGGILDRRERARQEQEEQLRRARALAEAAGFSRRFAGSLAAQQLAGREAVPEIARMLCRQLADCAGESYSEQEWAAVQPQLDMPEEPVGS